MNFLIITRTKPHLSVIQFIILRMWYKCTTLQPRPLCSKHSSCVTRAQQLKYRQYYLTVPIRWPLCLRSRSAAAGIAGSNAPCGIDECCELSGRSLCIKLIPRPGSPNECGESEYDREVSIMWRSWFTRGHCAKGKYYVTFKT